MAFVLYLLNAAMLLCLQSRHNVHQLLPAFQGALCEIVMVGY